MLMREGEMSEGGRAGRDVALDGDGEGGCVGRMDA